jgi:methyltransferase (TIGR00027 family)
MREATPSVTAQRVAAYRLAAARLPAPFGDPGADERLARDVLAGFDFEPREPMARYLRARTAFFDRVVLSAIERGNTQIVSIGAGFDARALRYANADVQWFEVDHPATQADKRARLDRLAIATPGVTYVPADLTETDVADALLDGGFEPDGPSLLMSEGLAVYLRPATLGALLAQLRSIATAGTRLALSAGIPAADPERRREFAQRVADVGEPITLLDTDTDTDVDVDAMLTAARWRRAEVSERSQRAGLIVGLPVWEPAGPSTRSRVGVYLERTFHRSRTDELGPHLTSRYGIQVTGTRRLDVGVLRVERADDTDWVARIFPAARPPDRALRDAEALHFLAEHGYPAERPAVQEPVSQLDGQAVLVTGYVTGPEPRDTPATYRRLGELLGRLHTVPDPPPGPGGAWHHLAHDGGPEAEIAALGTLLEARTHVPDEQRGVLAALRSMAAGIDDLRDLPSAFTHPDFVRGNTVVASTGDIVVIDWAGAGFAPRLWTLGFLLWEAGRAGPGQVDAAVAGYRRHIELDAAELDRLETAVAARPAVFDGWSYATGRRSLGDVMGGRSEIDGRVRAVAGRARAALRRPTPA